MKVRSTELVLVNRYLPNFIYLLILVFFFLTRFLFLSPPGVPGGERNALGSEVDPVSVSDRSFP